MNWIEACVRWCDTDDLNPGTKLYLGTMYLGEALGDGQIRRPSGNIIIGNKILISHMELPICQ